MLEWRNEVTNDLTEDSSLQLPSDTARSGSAASDSQQEGEVMILIWPAGDFVRLPRGTTAGQIVHDQVQKMKVCLTSILCHCQRTVKSVVCC